MLHLLGFLMRGYHIFMYVRRHPDASLFCRVNFPYVIKDELIDVTNREGFLCVRETHWQALFFKLLVLICE